MTQSFLDNLCKIIVSAISLLPKSPFADYYNTFAWNNQYLSWLNWILPIGDMLGILSVWLTAIACYYAFKVLTKYLGNLSALV